MIFHCNHENRFQRNSRSDFRNREKPRNRDDSFKLRFDESENMANVTNTAHEFRFLSLKCHAVRRVDLSNSSVTGSSDITVTLLFLVISIEFVFPLVSSFLAEFDGMACIMRFTTPISFGAERTRMRGGLLRAILELGKN